MVHRPERLPVTLNDTSFFVNLEGYRRTTVPVLREQQDSSDEAGEQTLLSQYWLRSQTDWSEGAGQEFFDNADSSRLRFSSSSGIDPWTKGQVSLLPICESKNNANSWTDVIMKVLGNYVYVASGTNLYYTSNVTAADGSVTWNTVTALGSPETITDFTSDGATVFIAYGAARVAASTPIGTTTQPSNFGTENPDYCRVVGGRLLFFDGINATEESNAGAPISSSLDHDLPLAGSAWVTGATGPAGIYLASNTETTGTIHFVPVKQTDGLLDSPQQVADLPHGETINDMLAYGGLLVLATSKGLRVASPDPASGGITYGPAIDDAGPANCLTADDRFVWWGGNAGQVYRADLSVFTDTLVPAYASDLVSVGDGNSLGAVTWIGRVAGTTVFVDAGNGVQGEESQGYLVASGTLDVGEVRWNSLYSKTLRSVEAKIEPTLVATGGITFNESGYTFDDGGLVYGGLEVPYSGTVSVSFQDASGQDTNSQTLDSEVRTVVEPAVASSSFIPTFTLTRDATNLDAGPVLQFWRMESFPSPTRVDEIILPIELSRRVATSRGMGAAATQSPQTLYDSLRSWMTAKSVVTYREGSRSESVIVDQLEFVPYKLDDAADWWEGTVTVRLLTVT